MNELRGDSRSDPGERTLTRGEILDEFERRVAASEPGIATLAKIVGLKAINHAHGLKAGDVLRNTVGLRIHQMLRPRAMVGELHGDVFLVLSQPLAGGEAEATLREATAAVCRPIEVGEVEVRPRITWGYAAFGAGVNVDQVLAEAGSALRTAQQTRAGIVGATDETRRQLYAEMVIDRDLARALAGNELSFAYQPIIAFDDRRIHGGEALLRWRHPELGPVSPELIVQRVAANGMFTSFTKWCIDTVANEWAGLLNRRPDFRGMSVSVNLSEAQLALPTCADIVSAAIERHRLDRESLIVELVESGPVAIGPQAEATLRRLAAAGTLIALDDFGAGHNALGYFLRFPIDAIKIDRTLSTSIVANPTARAIVDGVVKIAASLGVGTVAEGLETAVEANACDAIGVGFGQGWHLGLPTSLAEFEDAATRNRAGFDLAPGVRESLGAKRRSGDESDFGPTPEDVERFDDWLGRGDFDAEGE